AFARGGSIVDVNIGPYKVKYAIHKALLTEYSEYFKRALNGQWKEAQEGVVSLDDVKCRVFQIFVKRLYTAQLPEAEDWVSPTILQVAMVDACALADRIVSPAFDRAFRSKIVTCSVNSSKPPAYATIISAFDILPPQDPILRLLVDSHCHRYKEADDLEDEEELELRDQLPHEFLVRTMIRYSRIGSTLFLRQLKASDYH
ncbi:hypothetical protein EK21DRAFT_54309, partial [Setomelanomma holmii]